MTHPKDGYELLVRVSPVVEPWMPIYAKAETDVFSLGFGLLPSHCNSRGFAHGGVISAIADIAMGYSIQDSRNKNDADRFSATTLNLAIDYLHSGQLEQWLEFRPRVLRRSSTLAVAECHVYADEKLIARANGGFRIVER